MFKRSLNLFKVTFWFTILGLHDIASNFRVFNRTYVLAVLGDSLTEAGFGMTFDDGYDDEDRHYYPFIWDEFIADECHDSMDILGALSERVK